MALHTALLHRKSNVLEAVDGTYGLTFLCFVFIFMAQKDSVFRALIK